jgi:hypothetical protein
MRRLAMIQCLWLLVACGGGSNAGHSVAAKDYDRACEDVAECFPVFEGALSCCSTQACPNTAIREDKVATYMSDVDARRPMCASPVTPGTCRSQTACSAGRVECASGVCTLVFPSDGSATD